MGRAICNGNGSKLGHFPKISPPLACLAAWKKKDFLGQCYQLKGKGTAWAVLRKQLPRTCQINFLFSLFKSQPMCCNWAKLLRGPQEQEVWASSLPCTGIHGASFPLTVRLRRCMQYASLVPHWQQRIWAGPKIFLWWRKNEMRVRGFKSNPQSWARPPSYLVCIKSP